MTGAALLLVSFAPNEAVRADAPPEIAAGEAVEPVGGEDPAQKEARQAAGVAVYLLAGILVIGIFLIALVMVWGHRWRRIIRTSPSKSTSLDEFWYLRQNQLKQRLKEREAANSSDAEADQTES